MWFRASVFLGLPTWEPQDWRWFRIYVGFRGRLSRITHGSCVAPKVIMIGTLLLQRQGNLDTHRILSTYQYCGLRQLVRLWPRVPQIDLEMIEAKFWPCSRVYGFGL